MEIKPYIRESEASTDDIRKFLLQAGVTELQRQAGYIPSQDLTPLPLYHFFRRYERYSIVRIAQSMSTQMWARSKEQWDLNDNWFTWLTKHGFSLVQRNKIAGMLIAYVVKEKLEVEQSE